VLTTLNNLRFKEDNFNIKSCDCNNKKETTLKEFKF